MPLMASELTLPGCPDSVISPDVVLSAVSFDVKSSEIRFPEIVVNLKLSNLPDNLVSPEVVLKPAFSASIHSELGSVLFDNQLRPVIRVILEYLDPLFILFTLTLLVFLG